MSSLHELTSGITEIDDVQASHHPAHLRMFAIRVHRMFPKCSFGYADINSHQRGFISNRMLVYHTDNPYPMGMIGYGNFRRNGEGDDAYVVMSRKIKNNKYTYGEQENMFMSKNIEVAERNARKYLRDWTLMEVAGHHTHTLRNLWGGTDNDLDSQIRQKFSDVIIDRDIFIGELRMLASAGHDYTNAEFGGKVAELLGVYEDKMEKARERSSNIRAVMLRPSRSGSGNEYRVANCPDISQWGADWFEDATSYDDNTIPENISGKLAVLSMCEPDQWVDNVGFKADNKIFFVVQVDDT